MKDFLHFVKRLLAILVPSVYLFLKGGVFFLSSLKIGSQMGVSWAMNLLMYCSLPKKALISFSVFGTGMSIIALAFAGRLRFLFC